MHPAKKSAFSLMNSVRDHCEQSAMNKFLLLVIATYCDGNGFCYPSNEKLAKAIGKSTRSIRRMLRQLEADGELEIISPGIGRDTKRIISLTRYATEKTGHSYVPFKPDKAVSAKPDKVMSPLNRTRSRAKRTVTANDNSHEQPSDAAVPCGTSIPTAPAKPVPEESGKFEKDYQNHADAPVQSHVKWPEFVEHCHSKGGQPTEKGFWTWLSRQKEQWRNKRAPDFDEQGYTLHGKFMPAHEANLMAVKNPELITKFRRASRRNGKVHVCDGHADYAKHGKNKPP